MGGGTPLFPDLGEHCTHSSCKQLDFLPFQCDACHSVFCSQHRSYTDHSCPNAKIHDRVVVICPLCSSSVEKPHNSDAEVALRKHSESGECDPNRAKRPPPCAVKRCKEILTFSNSQVCKTCGKKTCLKHRFPSDHGCLNGQKNAAAVGQSFLAALEKRQREIKGNECGASASKAGKPSNPNSRVSFVRAQ